MRPAAFPLATRHSCWTEESLASLHNVNTAKIQPNALRWMRKIGL